MATPMRSTDFRAVVEPILNEVFDGVYDQRADEWKQVFDERKGIPARITKNRSCMVSVRLLNFPMAWPLHTNPVACCINSATCTRCTAWRLL